MNLRLGSSSRRTSPDRGNSALATDASTAELTLPQGKAPKRSGSFGKGLSTALANSMTKASEAMPGVGKKPSATAPSTPRASPFNAGKELPFAPVQSNATVGGGQAQRSVVAAPAGPDPSHLSNFSLRLSELVNQALAPTVVQAQPHTGVVTSSVTKHAPGRSHIPSIDAIVYEGRRLPKRAKIQEFAHTVVAELEYAKGVDSYLLRAASRAASKALTLFASRIDTLLIPVAKDPTSLVMPTTAKEGIHISPALEYNIGLATLIWIVEDALERCIEGEDDEEEGMPPFVSEILTPVRKRMETTILHVIQPVLSGVKISLTASILKATAHPFVSGTSPALTPSISNESPLPPVSPNQLPGSAFSSPKGGGSDVPVATGNWLKEIQGRLEGSRKLLVPRIEARTSQDGEGWFISVAIHLIWKGLFILTARPIDANATKVIAPATGLFSSSTQHALNDGTKRSPSPGQLSAALKSVTSVSGARARKPEAASAGKASLPPESAFGQVTPPTTVAEGKAELGTATPNGGTFAVPLAKHTLPVVASVSKATAAQISDLQAFQKLALRFCKGFVSDKALAAVAAELSRADAEDDVADDDQQLQEEDEEDELARQALAEALEATKSTLTVIQALDTNLEGVKLALARGSTPSPNAVPADGAKKHELGAANLGAGTKPLDTVQYRALKAIPPLLLLHLVYCRLPNSVKLPSTGVSSFISSPPALFGISWAEYERSIAGFVTGGSWAQAAVRRWATEVHTLWDDCEARRAELKAMRFNDEEEALATGEPGDGLIPGTTPTPARIAEARAAAATSDKGRSQLLERTSSEAGSDKTGTDPFQATPRTAAGAAAGSKALPTFRLGSSASLSSQKSATPSQSSDCDVLETASQASRSSIASPESSPALAPSVPGMDSIEPMEGSIGSLSAASVSSDKSTQSAKADQPQQKQQGKEKQRFWKSFPDSSGAPLTTVPSRGFLPLLSRSGFHRTASPGGSLRSMGARSRSSRCTDTASMIPDHGNEELNLVEAELVELARCQDALSLFAKVLEWAAWSSGTELKCRPGAQN